MGHSLVLVLLVCSGWARRTGRCGLTPYCRSTLALHKRSPNTGIYLFGGICKKGQVGKRKVQKAWLLVRRMGAGVSGAHSQGLCVRLGAIRPFSLPSSPCSLRLLAPEKG